MKLENTNAHLYIYGTLLWKRWQGWVPREGVFVQPTELGNLAICMEKKWDKTDHLPTYYQSTPEGFRTYTSKVVFEILWIKHRLI